jgi:hypothetical protein
MQIFAFVAGFVFTLLCGWQLVWRVIFNPSMCKRRHETPYPSALNDPRFGTHGFVIANGIKFHYVAKGPENAPLMLCLHGFPECWYSWRYILYAFSGTYRVVAIDLRGYGETTRVAPSWWTASDYSLRTLVEDVRSVIAALGYGKCTLVAHDWCVTFMQPAVKTRR